MKKALCAVSVVAVLAVVACDASAVSYTFYCNKVNFNDSLSGYANFSAPAGSHRFAKNKQETTFYGDWSATEKASMAAVLASAPTPGYKWQMSFQASSGPMYGMHGGIDFTPHIGTFYAGLDWTLAEACHYEGALYVPWQDESGVDVEDFWDLRQVDNTALVVGGWQTLSSLYSGVPVYSWSSAVLDAALVTDLLTNAKCRGLRAWDTDDDGAGPDTGWWNDATSLGGQWNTLGRPRIIIDEVLAARAGDTDLDGDIDFADYGAFEASFGITTGATWAQGDFDGDGDVDFADYGALEANFGTSAVPEPATLALVGLGLAGLAAARRRRGLKVLVAAVALLGLAGASQAATVTFSITGGGGTWNAYALVSTDCKGLSSFIVDVVGSGGLTVTGSQNLSPMSDNGMADLFGFYTFRSDGAAGVGVSAGQPTIYGATYTTAGDAKVLRDVGILPGSRLDPLSGNTITWGVPVLLASGTYSGTMGTLTVAKGDGVINVLKNVTGTNWRGPGNVLTASPVVPGSVYIIPEPATLALVLAGVAGLVARRRR